MKKKSLLMFALSLIYDLPFVLFTFMVSVYRIVKMDSNERSQIMTPTNINVYIISVFHEVFYLRNHINLSFWVIIGFFMFY